MDEFKSGDFVTLEDYASCVDIGGYHQPIPPGTYRVVNIVRDGDITHVALRYEATIVLVQAGRIPRDESCQEAGNGSNTN